MSLNVLAVADQVSDLLYDHFDRARWNHIDLILSCGDLAPSYLEFLVSSLDIPVFYVRGNHDASYPAHRYDGLIDVHRRIVEYRGVRIAGLAGCREYNGGRYQFSERQMNSMVRRLRLRAFSAGAPDILLTHAPPAGCHDAPDLPHRGFECFNTAINVWQPRYFVHGHVHAYNPGASVTEVGETTVMNAFLYREFHIEPQVDEDRERKKETRSALWTDRVSGNYFHRKRRRGSSSITSARL